jgi:cysteine desulfurase
VHERGALLHADAAQAFGKIPLDVAVAGVDLLSLTAHKCYGPKGSGALYLRRRRPRIPIECQIDGGGHEGGLRSGTLNVPGIVGLGAAAEIAGQCLRDESARLAALRDRLLQGLRSTLDGLHVNGSLERRLPHNLHVSFDGVEGEALLMALGDLAVSTGSACSSGSQKPSHVLEAIGAVREHGGASVRFGLGRWTSEEEIDFAVERVTTVVRALREKHPVGRA